jgi:hypothetical protein
MMDVNLKPVFLVTPAVLPTMRARRWGGVTTWYYLYTVVARSFIVVVMTSLYFKARDPLFLVLDTIVLIGLAPSIYVAAQSARA